MSEDSSAARTALSYARAAYEEEAAARLHTIRVDLLGGDWRAALDERLT